MPDSDAALIQTWITVWAHARGVAVTEVDGWQKVHLGSVSRQSELIGHDPDLKTFRRMLHHIAGDPRAMLTIVGHELDAYDRLALPADVRLDRDEENLMTVALVPLAPKSIDPGFTTGWDQQDNTSTFWIALDDRIAAEGSVGVLDGVATFDGVETTPRFRRCGLAYHVMANLTEQAMSAGAHQGILAATHDGRMLYESIGWQTRLQMRSFMGV